MISITPELIAALAGAITSLLFAYLPGLKNWFDGLDSQYKPLVNAAVLFLATAGYLLYSCRLDWACVAGNLEQAIWAFIAALMANQTTYLVGVRQFKRSAS